MVVLENFSRWVGAALPGQRRRSVRGSASAEQAARLLIAPTALMPLSLADARVVVRYMEPQLITRGTVFIHEGYMARTDHMLLLIEGEVMVENIAMTRGDSASMETRTVLGPGSLMGELSLVDGQARMASCTATTDLRCACLTRDGLEALTKRHPRTGAKFVLAVLQRVAERLRDTTDKLKLHVQLVKALQQETDHLMGIKKPPKPTAGHGPKPTTAARRSPV